MKNILQKIKKISLFMLKSVFTIFVIFFIFMGPIIIYWEIEENRNINKCVDQGESYDNCYQRFNW